MCFRIPSQSSSSLERIQVPIWICASHGKWSSHLQPAMLCSFLVLDSSGGAVTQAEPGGLVSVEPFAEQLCCLMAVNVHRVAHYFQQSSHGYLYHVAHTP